MKSILTPILLLLPFLAFSQLDIRVQANIDSLKQVLSRTQNASETIMALRAWDDLVRSSYRDTSIMLNQRIEQICIDQLSGKEFQIPEGEIADYLGFLTTALFHKSEAYEFKENKEEALQSLEQALQYQKEYGKQQGIAQALDQLVGYLLRNKDYKGTIAYAEQAIEINKAIGDTLSVIEHLNAIGSAHIKKGSQVEGIAIFKQGLELAEQFGDSLQTAEILLGLTVANCYIGKYDIALLHGNRSVEICGSFEGAIDTSKLMRTLLFIGYAHSRLGAYPQAIEYYYRNYELADGLNDKYKMSESLVQIGHIYSEQGKHDKAEEYYLRGLQLEEEHPNGKIYYNLGRVHKNKKDYDTALEYLYDAIAIDQEGGDPFTLGASYNLIGVVYRIQEKYDEALKYHKKGMDIANEINQAQMKLGILNDFGETYLMKGDLKRAVSYAKRALKDSRDLKVMKYEKNAAETLYESYKKKKESGRALHFHELFVELKDSLQNQTNRDALLTQELSYEYKKQHLADSIQNAELQKIKDAELAVERATVEKKNQQFRFLLAGLGLTIFFGGFIYNRFHVTRKQKRIIEQQKKQVDKSFSKIQEEQLKSESLLLNILPLTTALELKEKGSVAAKSYPTASVLFTDFKGFTALSEKLTPEELVKEIDFCFSAFDQITKRNGIEKIKTIGDAYMASGGVPSPSKDHALNTINAALEIRNFISALAEEKKQKNLPYFEIRIGIHSGPIVAGVVGLNKFQYDIWGDTVNIASHMESTSEVGKVNISETTYQLLKSEPGLNFTDRGDVEIKGKNKIKMYYVERQ